MQRAWQPGNREVLGPRDVPGFPFVLATHVENEELLAATIRLNWSHDCPPTVGPGERQVYLLRCIRWRHRRRGAAGNVHSREGTLAVASELNGLETVPAIRRVVEIALMDTPGLDNGPARNRTLLAGAQTAAKLT